MEYVAAIVLMFVAVALWVQAMEASRPRCFIILTGRPTVEETLNRVRQIGPARLERGPDGSVRGSVEVRADVK